MSKPTESKVQEMLDVGLFFEELQWSEQGAGFIFTCKAEQQFGPDVTITLMGSVNHKARSYKWQLLYNGPRIFAVEYPAPHHNPSCHDVASPHFHIWKAKYQNSSYAEYADFPENHDVLRALQWFSKKCNICVGRLPGSPPEYQDQGRLLLP